MGLVDTEAKKSKICKKCFYFVSVWCQVTIAVIPGINF